MNLTPEKQDRLLAEAKEKYPVGTKFIVSQTGYEAIVLSHEYHEYLINNADWGLYINFLVKYDLPDGCTSGSVYSAGKWAEIIPNENTTPQEQADLIYNNYPRVDPDFNGNIEQYRHLKSEITRLESELNRLNDCLIEFNVKSVGFTVESNHAVITIVAPYQYHTIEGLIKKGDKINILLPKRK